MALLRSVVRLVAHNHASLALPLSGEDGRRVYVEFSAGYGEISDSWVLKQLLDSPLRGPGRPAEFMILSSDEQLKKMIAEAESTEEVKAPRPTPYAEMTLAEAITHVFQSRKNFILDFDQVLKHLTDGGYVSQSKTVGQIVRSAIRTLEQKGVLVARGNDWQAADS